MRRWAGKLLVFPVVQCPSSIPCVSKLSSASPCRRCTPWWFWRCCCLLCRETREERRMEQSKEQWRALLLPPWCAAEKVLHCPFHLIFPSYLPEYLVTSNLLLLQWTGVKFPSFEAGRTKENSFFLPNFSLLSGEFCYISISHLKLKCSGPAAVLCGLSKVSNVMFIITCTVKRAHRTQQLLFPFYFSYLLSSGKAKNGEKCEICQGCCLAVQNMDSLSVLICSLQSP